MTPSPSWRRPLLAVGAATMVVGGLLLVTGRHSTLDLVGALVLTVLLVGSLAEPTTRLSRVEKIKEPWLSLALCGVGLNELGRGLSAHDAADAAIVLVGGLGVVATMVGGTLTVRAALAHAWAGRPGRAAGR